MADETLITPVPSATKIRTDPVRMVITYHLINGGGTPVGKKFLTVRSDDPALTANQKTAVINFATQALQVYGIIA